jgi:hypothetical protein
MAAKRSRYPMAGLLALFLGGILALTITFARDRDRSVMPAPSSVTPPTNASPPISTPRPTLTPVVPSPLPGYLLIADRGNNRVVLVSSDKQVLWRYPRSRKPSFPFRSDDDAFFGPGYRTIISQQETNQTAQVISFPAGDVLWHYGHPGVWGPGPGFLHTPDDAYLLDGGIRSVADIGNCRVLFISPGGKIVRQIGTTGVCAHDPPRFLASPNGDTPMPHGATLVTEIGGSFIDAISKSNQLLWSVHAPVRYPSDAQWLGHGRILLADYSKPGAVIIMTRTGKVLWRYGPSSGPAALDHPSLALRLPNGLIAVNDDFRDRVVLISRKRHRIIWQYGHTDHPGRRRGFLRIPDGMDFLPFGAAMRQSSIRSLVIGSG